MFIIPTRSTWLYPDQLRDSAIRDGAIVIRVLATGRTTWFRISTQNGTIIDKWTSTCGTLFMPTRPQGRRARLAGFPVSSAIAAVCCSRCRAGVASTPRVFDLVGFSFYIPYAGAFTLEVTTVGNSIRVIPAGRLSSGSSATSSKLSVSSRC